MATFERGLHDLGDGIFAYLQPDGSWGWSNAGLVTDGEASLLVDTLFDLRLTHEMLAEMRDAAPAAGEIDTLVNTHANGDHCYGNQLLAGARIIASSASAAEMDNLPPSAMAALLADASSDSPQLGEAGAFFAQIFGDFDFAGIEHTPPNETFEDALSLEVGDKRVELIEVGPAHTRGDVIVHVPNDGVVFTGDILFIDGTPIMWEGPVENWIAACDRITEMAPKFIVPGHGPLTDLAGVARMRDYLVFVRDESRARYQAGMSAADAALDIELGDFGEWTDSERIAVNVDSLYREFSKSDERSNIFELFALMSAIAKKNESS
jgi:cyclase